MPNHNLPTHVEENAASANQSELLPLAPASSIDTYQAVQRAHDPRIPARPADFLALQRVVGNQAVQRILAERSPASNTTAPSSHSTSEPLSEPSKLDGKSISKQVTSQQSPPRLMRSMADMPDRNIKHSGSIKHHDSIQHSAPKNIIQRAEDDDYMNSVGPGLASPFMMPFGFLSPGALQTIGTGAYHGAQMIGGGLKSAGKGFVRGAKAFGRGAMAFGRGAKSLGTGMVKGIGKGFSAFGRGIGKMGTGIKNYVNKDRNPNRYDRSRVPTSGSTNMELGKPGLALGASGGVLGGAESASLAAGFPAGSGTLNLLTAADAALTWYNGSKMRDAAKQRGDLAGEKVGTRKSNQGKWGLMEGIAGTVQGGLNLGTAIDVGSKGLMSMHDLASKASYVSSGLGIAGAGVGIAGSVISGAQGLWKSGKAASKLRRLGKSEPMITEDGDRWKARVKDREKTKLGLNVLKTVASGLGIAAGALVIASNPVGWALGVAAAATLGGLAAYKIYTKWKKTRRKKQAKERVRNEMEMPQREEIPEVDENDQNQGGEQGQDEAGMEQADPSQLDEQRRKQGVELGNRIAQQVSKSGKVAGEIRAAVPGHKDRYYKYLDEDLKLGHWTHAELRGTYAKGYPYPQHVLKAHDALVILSVLNLTPEEVESESGQELIEKKLSATDSL